jgi:uncharacterized protein (DUF1501 family)
MKRRDFFKYSGLGLSLSLVPQLVTSCASNDTNRFEDKVTVIIRIKGGMDGYHLIAPKGNDYLLEGRPSIQNLIEKEGIHWREDWYIRPNFGVISDLIQKNWLHVIPNVGYSDYNRLSHFKAQDYWETGSVVNDIKQYHNGWIGRLVDQGKIKALDNTTPVLVIDNEQTLFDKGDFSQGVYYTPYNRHADLNLYIEEWLKDSFKTGKHANLYESVKSQFELNNKLKDIMPNSVDARDIEGKLSQVADCIEKGLPFAVFNLTQTGYDTHNKQSIRLEPLALSLFEGIRAFAERLDKSGNWNRVNVLVYTEFGRTIAENSNGGTDHGTANHAYLLGGDLVDLWKNPDLGFSTIDIAGVNYIEHKVDFRDIYRSLI